MFDVFSYTGPKSPDRLEDELFIRALRMRDLEERTGAQIAKALDISYANLRWRFHAIAKESAAMEHA